MRANLGILIIGWLGVWAMDARAADLSNARELLEDGERREAREELDRILSTNPNDRDALEMRAHLLREDGYLEASAWDWERLTRLAPASPEIWFWAATVDRWLGRTESALRNYDQAVRLEDCFGDARTGRARVREALGDRAGALEDLERALACDGSNEEARELFARVTGESRAIRRVRLSAEGSRIDVQEGLDEEGLVRDGNVLRASEVRYVDVSSSVGVEGALALADWYASFEVGREAVENRDFESTIYDFDVLGGFIGVERTLNDLGRVDFGLGAQAFRSREERSVPSEDVLTGRLVWTLSAPAGAVRAAWTLEPLLARSFASEVAFRVFRRHRLLGSFEHVVARHWVTRWEFGHERFGDGIHRTLANLSLRRSVGGRSLRFSLRSDPFAARFLTPDRQLDFVDYFAAWGRLDWRSRGSWAAWVEGELGRMGTSRELIVADPNLDGVADLVVGEDRNNRRRRVDVGLEWEAPFALGWFVGSQYRSDAFDFDTAPYNTNNLDEWVFFVRAERTLSGVDSGLRFARRETRDERAPHSSGNEFELDLERDFDGGVGFRLQTRVTENSLDETGLSASAEVRWAF